MDAKVESLPGDWGCQLLAKVKEHLLRLILHEDKGPKLALTNGLYVLHDCHVSRKPVC